MFRQREQREHSREWSGAQHILGAQGRAAPLAQSVASSAIRVSRRVGGWHLESQAILKGLGTSAETVTDKMHPGAILSRRAAQRARPLLPFLPFFPQRGHSVSGLSQDTYHPCTATVTGSDITPQHGVSCVPKTHVRALTLGISERACIGDRALQR